METSIESSAPAQEGPKRLLVLIIEDLAPILEVEMKVLEMAGFQVQGFGSGEEALAAPTELLLEARIAFVDAVFGGLDAVKALRKINPQIKTVIVTGGTFEPHPQIDRIMLLPYSREDLIGVVHELLADKP